MKILIRAEGGVRIGMGHVMRMLVLADALKEYADVEFACRDAEEFMAGMQHIKSCGYPVHRINCRAVTESLGETGGDCLITDSYDVDEEYFDNIKRFFKTTGYMDDLNKHSINTDFIINQNIYAGELEYKTAVGTRLFLGTQYVLLREEFRSLQKREIKDNVKNVLITLGGADPRKLTETIALQLSRSFPETAFHIAVGPSFTNRDKLLKISGENILAEDSPKMSQLMLECDAAISSCGSTIYELCACGTPIIGLVTADNQVMAARKMASIGALKYAREPDGLADQLKGLNFETRVNMSEKGQSLVDGYGSTRLTGEIIKIICSL